MSSEQKRAAFQRREPNETSGSGKGGSTSDDGKDTRETPEELQKLRDLKSQTMDTTEAKAKVNSKVKANDKDYEDFTDTADEDWVGDVASCQTFSMHQKNFGLETKSSCQIQESYVYRFHF